MVSFGTFLGAGEPEGPVRLIHAQAVWTMSNVYLSTVGNKMCTSQLQTSIFIHAISCRDWCFQVPLIEWNESNTAAWKLSASSNLTQQPGAPPERRSRLNLRRPPADSWYPWCSILWGDLHHHQSVFLQKTLLCMFGSLYPSDRACACIASSSLASLMGS